MAKILWCGAQLCRGTAFLIYCSRLLQALYQYCCCRHARDCFIALAFLLESHVLKGLMKASRTSRVIQSWRRLSMSNSAGILQHWEKGGRMPGSWLKQAQMRQRPQHRLETADKAQCSHDLFLHHLISVQLRCCLWAMHVYASLDVQNSTLCDDHTCATLRTRLALS